jgi:hypothetical protein
MKALKISPEGIIYFFLTAILLLILFESGTTSTYSQQQTKSTNPDTMNSYLIKFPHTPGTCLATLDKFSSNAPELLNRIEWGCMSGDHTGYLIVERKNEVSALQTIPAVLRSDAKVEKLDKFTMEQIKEFHQQHH